MHTHSGFTVLTWKRIPAVCVSQIDIQNAANRAEATPLRSLSSRRIRRRRVVYSRYPKFLAGGPTRDLCAQLNLRPCRLMSLAGKLTSTPICTLRMRPEELVLTTKYHRTVQILARRGTFVRQKPVIILTRGHDTVFGRHNVIVKRLVACDADPHLSRN
jgi:hypothetical protein